MVPEEISTNSIFIGQTSGQSIAKKMDLKLSDDLGQS